MTRTDKIRLAREKAIQIRQVALAFERKGFCNCCGTEVTLLTDEELGESVCRVCRSYDVRRLLGSVAALPALLKAEEGN
jgi:hypothetical protein